LKIKNVCCFGSGLIGTGWATNFLMAGLDVTLYDLSEDLFPHAEKRIRDNFAFLVKAEVYTPAQVEIFMKNFTMTSDVSKALKSADFVQESGPEKLEIKQEMAKIIDANCRVDTIVASSTSGFLISDIAARAKRPERFVGAHPYNPVFLLPLVEMTRSDVTDEGKLQQAYDFYMEIGKEPIILRKEALGFISNRIQMAVYREALDLLDRGVCSMDEIDRAVVYGPGLRWGLLGHFAVFHLTGGDEGLAGNVRKYSDAQEMWWRDMADWKKYPDGLKEKLTPMMDEALALRDERHGRTNEEIIAFRDQGLVLLLKYHGKL
jgi:3-hydroxyacyl-CoA dehydrogenase